MSDPQNIADLKNWRDGLPAVAVWPVDGFNVSTQADLLRAGHRLLPSVRMPIDDGGTDIPLQYQPTSDVKAVKALDQFAADFAYLDQAGVPICLRANNICDSFTKSSRYRVGYGPDSPLVWRQLADGTLEDSAVCDSLAPAAIWASEGQRIAQCQYLQKLQQLIKSPAWLMLVENNEGAYENQKSYAGLMTVEQLRTKSVRLADDIAGESELENLGVDMLNRERGQYRNFFYGFDDDISIDWPQPLTAAYGGLDRTMPGQNTWAYGFYGWSPYTSMYDAASPKVYIESPQLSDLTNPIWTEVTNYIPDWERRRQLNPQSWREVSVSLKADYVNTAKAAGRHEAITTDVWGGFMGTLLWLFHEPGVPVLLRHWSAAATKPTAALGAATVGDYVTAELQAVNRILDNPTIRDFWEHGKPVVTPGPVPWSDRARQKKLDPFPRPGDPDNRRRWLNCSANTADDQNYYVQPKQTYNGQIKVWAVATQLEGRDLIHAWTPCAWAGECTVTIPGVGDIALDLGPVPCSKYFVVKPPSGWEVAEVQ